MEDEFGRPITEVIKDRRSVRTYNGDGLTPELKEKLNQFFLDLKGPFGLDVRFIIMDNDLLQKEDVKLGTYGVIKGAKSFIAATTGQTHKSLEEYGYLFERVVLYATSLGLGTCWLGGTFKKGEFAKAIALKADEILPCVSPIGYARDNKSIIEASMRFFVGADKRKAWYELFFYNTFQSKLSHVDAGKYAIPLEMVRLAPSASNKQPWRIVKEDNVFHFYLQRTKGYAKALPFDIQRVDMGIAMCHFELAARELGISGEWKEKIIEIRDIPEGMQYITSWVEC